MTTIDKLLIFLIGCMKQQGPDEMGSEGKSIIPSDVVSDSLINTTTNEALDRTSTGMEPLHTCLVPISFISSLITRALYGYASFFHHKLVRNSRN